MNAPEAPATVACHFTKKFGEHPADPRYTPCCSSHGKPLCCHHYRWSHFVETGCDCCLDGIEIKARIATRHTASEAEDWERIPSCDTADCDTCGAPKGTCCQHCPYVISGHPTAAALDETEAPR